MIPRQIERVVSTALPTTFGSFEVVGYRSLADDRHHVALVNGEIAGGEDVLAGVHAQCVAGDVFHSLGCECHRRLESTLAMIEREGKGVLVYLSQAGRPLDPTAHGRDRGIGAKILLDLGLGSARVIADEAGEVGELEASGLRVTGRVATDATAPVGPRSDLFAAAGSR